MKIETITAENFAPYGCVLDFTEKTQKERFEVLVTEKQQPWRLAVFRVVSREAERMECHPDTYESFVPLKGCGVLVTAKQETPWNMRLFLLDCPVCLRPGVWHEVIALSEEAHYQITENLEVDSRFYPFERPLTIGGSLE